jgi:transposase
MAEALLPDPLWDLVEPFLPILPRRPQGGRPRVSDRACLTGILFVLRSGIPWQMLPQELGCGSGMTCWRRLRDWQCAGVWDVIHFALLDWLARDDRIDWSRAVVTVVPSAPCTAVTRLVRTLPIGPSAGASAI